MKLLKSGLFISIFSLPILLLLSACGGGEENATGSVTAKFTVASLSSELPINQPTSELNWFEYRWAVIFDIDNDNQISAGDLKLMLFHINQVGGQPANVSPAEMQASVFVLSKDGISTDGDLVANANVSVEGSTITLSVAKAAYSGLADIKPTTGVYFHTIGYDSTGTQFHDVYPSLNIYTDVPSTDGFIDTIDPYDANGFDAVDLQSMEIIITE